GVGPDDPATCADHAGAERRGRDVIRLPTGAQHSLVVTEPARHIERSDAERAHVAERHRLDLVTDAADQNWAMVARGLGPGHRSLKFYTPLERDLKLWR